MSEAACKVIITGVLEGRDREEVKAKLAGMFKKTPSEMEQYLSGKAVVVKKNLPATQAKKYQAALQKAGANCIVKPVGDAKPAKPAKPAEPAKNRMTCPKCEFEQDESDSCVKCGIVVEKFKKMQAEKEAVNKPTPPVPPVPPVPPSPPGMPQAKPGMPGHEDFHVGMHMGEEDKDPIIFMDELPKVFAYPFSGNGKFIIFGGIVFFLLTDILSLLPMVGLILKPVAMGYIIAYFFSVINTSAEGHESPPEWPAFTDFAESIIMPIIRIIFVWLVSYSFPVLYILLGWFVLGGISWPIVILLALFGSIYFPMAVLAVAMSGRMVSALPMVVIPAMLNAPVDYIICLVAYLVVIIMRAFANQLLALPIPFVGLIIQYFIMLYFLIVTGRLLGNFYNANQDKLGWYVD